MSAATQPNSYDPQAMRSGDASSVPDLFSSVLHNAAFISSEGRIYRLFPENEKVSLGRTFSLDNFRNRSVALSEDETPDEPMNLPDIVLPRETSVPERPIEETIKRKRAVEGICGRYQPTRPIRIFQSFSEGIRLKATFSVPAQAPVAESGETSSRHFIAKFPAPSTSNAHAGSPLRRQVSVRGRSLFEPQSAEDRNSIFRCTLVPVLIETPDFFEQVAQSSSDPTPNIVLYRESEHKPAPETKQDTEIVEKIEVIEKPEPVPVVRILRLDIPAVFKERKFRRIFDKKHVFVRHERRAGETESPTILLHPLTEPTEPNKEEPEPADPETIAPERFVTEPAVVTQEVVEIPAEEVRTEEPAVEEPASKFVPYLHLGDAHVPPIEWSNWKPRWPEHIDSLKHRAGESIRLLSDHLVSLHQRGIRVVSFNGFHSGDGCTTVALCAARQLAARGFRILLADAHADNPAIPRLLDIPFHPTFYEIVFLEEHLDFLPWSETAIEVEQDGRIESRHFGDLVAMVRNDFDLVLVDNGPLVERSLTERKTLWHEMGSDGVLLVVNRQHRDSVNLSAIDAKLRGHGIELLGITENYVRSHDEPE